MNCFKILFCICQLAQILEFVQSGHLHNFVTLKSSNFSNWLKSRDLDPFPPIKGSLPIKIRTYLGNLDFNLRNYGVHGHSDGITFHEPRALLEPIGIYNISYFLSDFQIDGNVTYFGDYSVNGTLFSNVSISGKGKWHISTPFLEVVSNRVSFDITQSGPLIVYPSWAGVISFGSKWHDVYFQNLDVDHPNDSILELVKEIIFVKLPEHLIEYMFEPHDPVTIALFQYWREILSETTLQDILNAPFVSENVKWEALLDQQSFNFFLLSNW